MKEMLLRLHGSVGIVALALSACGHRQPSIAPPPPPAKPLALLAGTTLAFRTAQTIDSTTGAGRTFAAVVSRDANDASGQTVLPSGSPASLILVQRPGTGTNAGFELVLASVMLNGNSYLVRNESDSASDTGAHLGTFLGGVPGTLRLPPSHQNPDEISISLTQDKFWIPVGSLITFRLDRPVRLIGSP